jgi:hypothetical protein
MLKEMGVTNISASVEPTSSMLSGKSPQERDALFQEFMQWKNRSTR